MTDRRIHPTSAVLAILGGVAWGMAFQETPRPWLAAVGFAPILVLLGRPHAVAFTFFAGVVSWLVAMPWIAATLETFGGLPPTASAALFLLLTLVLGLDFAVFAALGRGLWRRGGAWAIFGLPGLWVVIEQARGFFVHGFPWNLAAYAWTDLVGAPPLGAWIGAPGVSWLVIATNVAVASLLHRRRERRDLPVATLLTVALLLGLGARFAAEPWGDGPGLDVRLLQPNTPMTWDEDEIRAGYEGLLELSRASCDAPALVVWPESAAFPFGWERSPRLRADVAALARGGCPVLLGSPLAVRSETGELEGILNAAFVVGPDGMAGEPYAKRRLVPWGEYVPGKDLFPWIGKIARQAGDFLTGDDVALIDVSSDDSSTERLGLAVCYEVIFPLPVAEQVRAGATVLVSITNDSWYGDSSAPWQHLRAARWRAAETRRPLLRAALTGVSAVVDRRGRVVDRLGIDERGVLRLRVRGSREITPFVRAPWLPTLLVGLASAFAILGARRRPADSDLKSEFPTEREIGP